MASTVAEKVSTIPSIESTPVSRKKPMMASSYS
jgi:hypothetical protein